MCLNTLFNCLAVQSMRMRGTESTDGFSDPLTCLILYAVVALRCSGLKDVGYYSTYTKVETQYRPTMSSRPIIQYSNHAPLYLFR